MVWVYEVKPIANEGMGGCDAPIWCNLAGLSELGKIPAPFGFVISIVGHNLNP
jgi:hypothetical protein